MCPVTLIGKGSQQITTYALVDTGADTTMLHARWLDRLGLRLKSGRAEKRWGIDNKAIDVYVHRIWLKIGNRKRVRCEVAFSEQIGDDPGDQLLGRETVFDELRFAFRQRVGMFYLNAEI